jgi:hypothetical protein
MQIITNPFFWLSMVFALIATSCIFSVRFHLEEVGQEYDWLKPSLVKDFRSYELYWKIAPDKGWSRFPLIIGGLSFSLTFVFLVLTATR